MNMLADTPTLAMQIAELIPIGQLTAATINPLDKQSSVPCQTFTMPQQAAQAEAWVSEANAQGRNCYFHTNVSDVQLANTQLDRAFISHHRLWQWFASSLSNHTRA
jgi:hypothetical protein